MNRRVLGIVLIGAVLVYLARTSLSRCIPIQKNKGLGSLRLQLERGGWSAHQMVGHGTLSVEGYLEKAQPSICRSRVLVLHI